MARSSPKNMADVPGWGGDTWWRMAPRAVSCAAGRRRGSRLAAADRRRRRSWPRHRCFPVPDDHPPAALTKRLQVRIVGADDLVPLSLRASELRFEVGLCQRMPIGSRILAGPVLEMARGDRKRIATAKRRERCTALQSE